VEYESEFFWEYFAALIEAFLGVRPEDDGGPVQNYGRFYEVEYRSSTQVTYTADCLGATATPTGTATATASPAASATGTPTVTATATATSTPTPTATASATPAANAIEPGTYSVTLNLKGGNFESCWEAATASVPATVVVTESGAISITTTRTPYASAALTTTALGTIDLSTGSFSATSDHNSYSGVMKADGSGSGTNQWVTSYPPGQSCTTNYSMTWA
jgi:hypothetical protein